MANFTKNAIKQTFIGLLETKALSKITVQDIADACGINRNSFYYHFQDIPALIEEIIMEEADRLIAEYPTISSLEKAILVAVDFAKKNQKMARNIYHSANRDIFEQHLWKICDYVVHAYGESAFPDVKADPESVEILADYYKCVCFGIIMEWMEKGMPQDTEAMVHKFLTLSEGMVERTLKRAEK